MSSIVAEPRRFHEEVGQRTLKSVKEKAVETIPMAASAITGAAVMGAVPIVYRLAKKPIQYTVSDIALRNASPVVRQLVHPKYAVRNAAGAITLASVASGLSIRQVQRINDYKQKLSAQDARIAAQDVKVNTALDAIKDLKAVGKAAVKLASADKEAGLFGFAVKHIAAPIAKQMVKSSFKSITNTAVKHPLITTGLAAGTAALVGNGLVGGNK